MNRELLTSLAWGIGIVLVALAATIARRQGYIDQDTTLRIVAMNGLFVAHYGNRIPKAVAPSAHMRQAMRVTGWALVLGGLTYAAFWAFAPLPLAKTLGTGSLAAAVMVSVVHCLWLRRQARRSQTRA